MRRAFCFAKTTQNNTILANGSERLNWGSESSQYKDKYKYKYKDKYKYEDEDENKKISRADMLPLLLTC